MSAQLFAELAERLRIADTTRTPIDPIGPLLASGDVDAAYSIQVINTEATLADGRTVIGRKIGLTNPVVQQQLGVDQPDFGVLFDHMTYVPSSVVPFEAVLQPRIEAEMVFVLGADIDDPDASLDEVRAAVAGVAAGLEIVGSRIADWKITITDTIADNASSGALVVSDHRVSIDDVDLTGATMRLLKNGDEQVSAGSGAACLGSPLLAAQWLAREVARRGRPLRAGEIILTGALGPMVSVTAGDQFTADIDGLGLISCSFA